MRNLYINLRGNKFIKESGLLYLKLNKYYNRFLESLNKKGNKL